MICPYCKNEIQENSSFCPTCGNSVLNQAVSSNERDYWNEIRAALENSVRIKKKSDLEMAEQKREKNKTVFKRMVGFYITIIIILALTAWINGKILEYKYSYVQSHQSNENQTTYQYLRALSRRDYKDSSTIYEELYSWKLTNIIVNSSKNDKKTNLSSIKSTSPLYIHFMVEGGLPKESLLITANSRYPSGNTDSYVFTHRLDNGDTTAFFFPEGVGGKAGTLTVEFYDEYGNLIATKSVKITN